MEKEGNPIFSIDFMNKSFRGKKQGKNEYQTLQMQNSQGMSYPKMKNFSVFRK